MAESSWQPVMGAAQRRRQRRLRSWWRHEQQSIAAALATVMHHSSSKVHTANGAPRSQKLATRAEEEEVEHVPHYALRGQKTPPPRERPAPLSEVAGPQRSDRTVRRSAGEAPLLAVTTLTPPPSPTSWPRTSSCRRSRRRRRRRRGSGESSGR